MPCFQSVYLKILFCRFSKQITIIFNELLTYHASQIKGSATISIITIYIHYIKKNAMVELTFRVKNLFSVQFPCSLYGPENTFESNPSDAAE